jgi:hypothetical protein
MQQHTHHDTSTQAMTEVALGLSMAFFCLLILALFSINIPDQIPTNQADLDNKTQLTIADNQQKSDTASAAKDQQQYVFYFNGQFYNRQLTLLQADHLARFIPEQPLILAVPESLPLKQLMLIRQKINHPNLSITMLDQKWQTQLEKIQ